jgi:filamentous hemagglutinin family protein
VLDSLQLRNQCSQCDMQKHKAFLTCGVTRVLLANVLACVTQVVVCHHASADLEGVSSIHGATISRQMNEAGQVAATAVQQSAQSAHIVAEKFSVFEREQFLVHAPNDSALLSILVTGNDPSIIAGQISSNGRLAIYNGNGIHVVDGAVIDVAALLLSTGGVLYGENGDVFNIITREGAKIVIEKGAQINSSTLGFFGERIVIDNFSAAKDGVVIAGATLDVFGDGVLKIQLTNHDASNVPDAVSLIAAGEEILNHKNVSVGKNGEILIAAIGSGSNVKMENSNSKGGVEVAALKGGVVKMDTLKTEGAVAIVQDQDSKVNVENVKAGGAFKVRSEGNFAMPRSTAKAIEAKVAGPLVLGWSKGLLAEGDVYMELGSLEDNTMMSQPIISKTGRWFISTRNRDQDEVGALREDLRRYGAQFTRDNLPKDKNIMVHREQIAQKVLVKPIFDDHVYGAGGNLTTETIALRDGDSIEGNVAAMYERGAGWKYVYTDGEQSYTRLGDEIEYGTGIIRVDPKPIEAEANAVISKEFDGTTKVDLDPRDVRIKEGDKEVSFRVGDDDVHLKVKHVEFDSPDAGDNKTVKVGVGLIGEDAKNYRLIKNELEIAGSKIRKVNAVLKLPEVHEVYGDAPSELNVPPARTLSGKEVPVKGFIDPRYRGGTDVGQYPIEGHFEPLDPNYELKVEPGLRTISPKPIQIRGAEVSKDYDGHQQQAQSRYHVTGINPGDELHVHDADASLRKIPEQAGSYHIPVQNVTIGNPNYVIQDRRDGVLNITKVPVTVGVKAQRRMFGEENRPFELEVRGEVLANDLEMLKRSVGMTTGAYIGAHPGNYPVRLKQIDQLNNYDVTLEDGVIEVLPLPAEVIVQTEASDKGHAVAQDVLLNSSQSVAMQKVQETLARHVVNVNSASLPEIEGLTISPGVVQNLVRRR